VLADAHRRGDRGQRRLGQVGQHRGVGRAFHQDDELVAAHPGREVSALGGALAQPVGHGNQQVVADVVAERVVDPFEAVEVEVADAEPVRGLGRGDQVGQAFAEEGTVRQAGERVVQRLVSQAGPAGCAAR